MRVRWQTADNKWTNVDDDVMIYSSETPEQNKWQKIQGMATVPAGVGRLVILAGQANQPTNGQRRGVV